MTEQRGGNLRRHVSDGRGPDQCIAGGCLVLSFRTILRIGAVANLHHRLASAHAANIHALQRFVRTVRHDLGAVEGAVTESWSKGPVEGHVNRLKTLRRQMYGRAGVELLRARLVPLVTS